jgi:alpha-beta hydrolase superfamily lysophospholipase
MGVSAKSARRAARVAAAAALLVAGCAQLGQKERELVFRIQPGTAPWFDGLPDNLQELAIAVPAAGSSPGKLDAWWWPAADPHAPAVLYLHGARWNLTGQLFRIEQLHAFGFSVLAIDYRGFGKSEGTVPSEKTVYEDARAAWNELTQLQPDARRRFIYGHSLGSAVAVDLAASLAPASDGSEAGAPPARGLIIESSFTNLAEMAQALTWSYLPVGLLLSEKFDSASKIGAVNMPVLLVHGTSDRFVPARFSQELYDKVQGVKKLLLVQGGNHNNSMRLGSDDYRKAIDDLFGLQLKPVAHALN